MKRLDLAMKLAARATPADLDLMIDLVTHSNNEELVRGAQSAAAEHITKKHLEQIIARYEATADEAAAARLAGIVGQIHTAEALPELERILFSPNIPIDDALSAAALSSTAHLGSPPAVNLVAKRLEQATAVEKPRIAHTLSRIRAPGAERELGHIATGQRPWQALHTRLAALQGLANYPLSLTRTTLEHILQSPSAPPEVQQAAQRLLTPRSN